MQRVKNKELVTQIVGHWPSFHDAGLREMQLSVSKDGSASMAMELQVFDMLPNVDPTGHFKQKSACAVKLCFSNVVVQQISLVTFPDIVFSLRIEESDRDTCSEPTLQVELLSAIEGQVVFTCGDAWIESAEGQSQTGCATKLEKGGRSCNGRHYPKPFVAAQQVANPAR